MASRIGEIPFDERDAHNRRLHYRIGRHMDEVGPDDVRRARRAYYAVMSWLDERIGRVLDTLEATGEKERTIIVLSADHGDMLGERGLWYKMSFFEWSARVPMVVHAPGIYRPRRVKENVSLVDLFPTFLEWAGDGAMPELVAPIDGDGLANLSGGSARGWPDTVFGEYPLKDAAPPGTEQPGPRTQARPPDQPHPRSAPIDAPTTTATPENRPPPERAAPRPRRGPATSRPLCCRRCRKQAGLRSTRTHDGKGAGGNWSGRTSRGSRKNVQETVIGDHGVGVVVAGPSTLGRRLKEIVRVALGPSNLDLALLINRHAGGVGSRLHVVHMVIDPGVHSIAVGAHRLDPLLRRAGLPITLGAPDAADPIENPEPANHLPAQARRRERTDRLRGRLPPPPFFGRCATCRTRTPALGPLRCERTGNGENPP